MANSFITQQCQNMITSIDLFESACQMAASKDDGIISKEEQKVLKKIKAAGDKFKRELTNIKNQ